MSHSPSEADRSFEIVASSQVRELASGIDSMYLSGRAVLPEAFVDRLERARGRALDGREPVGFDLGGVEFGLTPFGWGRYPYRLSHEYGLIGFTPSEHLPAVRVQPKAQLLHGIGPAATVDTFSSVVSTVASVEWSVARADLFADVQGFWPGANTRERFVCRARTLATFEEAGDLTGFQFGKRRGGGITARMYEKSGQARKTGADYWFEMWGEKYRPGEPVARVEIEFGRKVLHQCEIESPDDLFSNLAGLWGYGTEWLSYRQPTADKTRSRAPVAPEWEAIRNVSLRDRAVTVQRTTSSKKAATERQIIQGLCGYLSSFAAIRNVDSIGASLDLIDPVLRDYERETGIPFSARVHKKRQKWEWGL
ncbi:MAG: hypothetical protein WEE36_02400 [Acidimicrobiia bacterium]